MNNAPTSQTPQDAQQLCKEAYDRAWGAWQNSSAPNYSQRVATLKRLRKWIQAHHDAIIEAANNDFNGRSSHETLMTEIMMAHNAIKHTLSHLRSWMRSEHRPVFWAFLPGRAEIQRQPLGVVGIIAPWNYPFQLATLPLIAAISAGNRVLLKPSELTPHMSELIDKMCSEVFEADEVIVVQGGPDVGAAFSALPVDHLFYTGSTHVGRLVMQAAAANLTPVTLELGGKSPVILHPSFSTRVAAERVGSGKLLNAGQTCLAPDYVLLDTTQQASFVEGMKNWVAKAYPKLIANPDYTAVINARHEKRLLAHIEDARAKGATIVTLNPGNEDAENTNGKVLPTLILDASDEMTVMQEEIFGPLLPIKTVPSVGAAIEYVNNKPRPLALYYFDNNATRVKKVLSDTVSGGAVVNDVLFHVAQEDLPFGGVGPSGMGAYHGETGFLTFSHEKSVFRQARVTPTKLFNPPYGKFIEYVVSIIIR